jgi:hypothetical protein
MSKIKILQVNKGIANRFPNGLIEINKKLSSDRYSDLYNEIITHEVSHSDIGWEFKDFMLDLRGFKNKKKFWQFVFTTPNSWWQFLPIYKSSYGFWFFDITLLLTYGFLAVLIGLIRWTII